MSLAVAPHESVTVLRELMRIRAESASFLPDTCVTGTQLNTVLTENTGQAGINVLQDRAGTFDRRPSRSCSGG